MDFLDRLFEIEDAFCATKECRETFLGAVREALRFHYENCSAYGRLCDNGGFNPEELKSEEDFPRIPHIMVNAFKWYTLQSVPDDEIAFEFTSSGTSGQKSHILWDEESKRRQSMMREKIMKSLGLVSENKVNYLVFAYSPEVSGKKGAAYAQQMYTTFAPAAEKFFAIRADGSGVPFFDVEGAIEKLNEFASSDIPARLIGFPAFIHETLEEMKGKGIKLALPAESLVITAGGWKDKEEKKIPIEVFREELSGLLGIGEDRMRDVYGFVEHGVPYVTCSKGHFHVPIYSRAYARKPGSLEVLDYGEKGLLHVISPYNLAQPALSVLSTDYVRIRKGCGCGIETDYIELAGRAGVKKHQGCAITATELLKK
ncbi:MAG: acyl-protein synthetase [Acidobacteria bacterium]|nr:acyl-protein synthetase [Acidobacteriota bacterium]